MAMFFCFAEVDGNVKTVAARNLCGQVMGPERARLVHSGKSQVFKTLQRCCRVATKKVTKVCLLKAALKNYM